MTLFALDALAVAAQSLVADALGAGDVFTARRAADRTLRWALAAGVAVGVGIAAAGPIVPALFTSDSNTAAAAEGPLRLVAALQPLNAAVFVGDGRAPGRRRFRLSRHRDGGGGGARAHLSRGGGHGRGR